MKRTKLFRRTPNEVFDGWILWLWDGAMTRFEDTRQTIEEK
jgi:hypothetical protein